MNKESTTITSKQLDSLTMPATPHYMYDLLMEYMCNQDAEAFNDLQHTNRWKYNDKFTIFGAKGIPFFFSYFCIYM